MASGFESDLPEDTQYMATYPATQPPRRGFGMALALLVAFLVGIAVCAVLVRNWAPAARAVVPTKPPVVVTVPRPVVVPTPAQPTGQDPALAAQVDSMDERLNAIDARARAAVGDADRAEGLLVTFAARRVVDRGASLGYLEGLLREHFGRSQPQAVATVISAARRPVSLADLRTGLDAARPGLVSGGSVSSWAAVRRELSSLLVLRRSGTSSTAPSERFDRASEALAAGEVDVALAEVARMPGRAAATDWIAGARRYLAVRAALDRLETAALVEPGPAPVVMPPSEDTLPAS